MTRREETPIAHRRGSSGALSLAPTAFYSTALPVIRSDVDQGTGKKGIGNLLRMRPSWLRSRKGVCSVGEREVFPTELGCLVNDPPRR